MLSDAELERELLVVVTLMDAEDDVETDGVGETPGVELEDATGQV
jgi:hypothetical protein